jgi:hypothetical protein
MNNMKNTKKSSNTYEVIRACLIALDSCVVRQMKCLCPAADGRNILKANAVRLAPWDRTQDHSRFLQLCRDEGLHLGAANGQLGMARNGGELLGRLMQFDARRYVIPSFDLGAFLSEDARRFLGP